MGQLDPDAVEYIPPEAASTYAKLAERYGFEYYRSVAADIVEYLNPGDRLLDAGTGPGFLPILIAEQMSTVRIHAFDFTHELLRYGAVEAKRRKVDDLVSFFAADCYAIPVPDCTYPFLLSTGVLHSLDDPRSVLAEFHRVLEPGGSAWVFDPAILDLPEEPDLDLTDHEQTVFQTYGVQTAGEQRSISMAQANRLVEDSPFTESSIAEGEAGDIRLYLSRKR